MDPIAKLPIWDKGLETEIFKNVHKCAWSKNVTSKSRGLEYVMYVCITRLMYHQTISEEALNTFKSNTAGIPNLSPKGRNQGWLDSLRENKIVWQIRR